jgi:hypothetical protein
LVFGGAEEVVAAVELFDASGSPGGGAFGVAVGGELGGDLFGVGCAGFAVGVERFA